MNRRIIALASLSAALLAGASWTSGAHATSKPFKGGAIVDARLVLHAPQMSGDAAVSDDASVKRGVPASLRLTGPNGELVTDAARKGGHLHVAVPCDATSGDGAWTATLNANGETLAKTSVLPCR